MPLKTSGGKWKWGNIERSSKKELVQTVYGIWKKNGSKGSFSDFWHGKHKVNEDYASIYSSLTVKEKNTEFGKVWFISEINGLFSFSLYRYDDDLDDIYLSDVVVRKEDRGKGFGNKILELAEKAARKMNAKEIRLKVDDSNQFAHDWYKRHGFSDMKHDKDETSRMWMKKKLTESKGKYEPPWTLDQIKMQYPDKYEMLSKDPVHRWRATTGIELIHKEPTKSELKRIWKNWNLMDNELKVKSDEKSQELFRMSNEEHYQKLIKKY